MIQHQTIQQSHKTSRGQNTVVNKKIVLKFYSQSLPKLLINLTETIKL